MNPWVEQWREPVPEPLRKSPEKRQRQLQRTDGKKEKK